MRMFMAEGEYRVNSVVVAVEYSDVLCGRGGRNEK